MPQPSRLILHCLHRTGCKVPRRLSKDISPARMCFHIIPLCPGCEEPSGLGEEIIYSDEICCGHCPAEDVCGSTTRLLTRHEVQHTGFECSTPDCDGGRDNLAPHEEEAEVNRARDHAKRFLRETYEDCLSLCILPFVEEPLPSVEVNATHRFCVCVMILLT